MANKANSQKKDTPIVVIGGGTGSFSMLLGLKEYFSDITALVNMVDDGGSTGVLRDELGVLPPGDVRQCLVALSDAPDTLRQLFNFRFDEGTFAGHSFGNLFLSAVERMSESFDEAVKSASEVLQIQGVVLPITIDDCRLMMKDMGRVIAGESAIDATKLSPLTHPPEMWIEPPATITKSAKEAIARAKIIMVAPGSLYCSLIPALLVDGMKEALASSDARVVYVANLVNKPHHTQDFTVGDYVRELERFMGSRRIDTVLYNLDTPTPELMKKYALDGEYPVRYDKKESTVYDPAMIGIHTLQKVPAQDREGRANSSKKATTKKDVRITRSYIRHDGSEVARYLYENEA